MGIPVKSGRVFLDSDAEGAAPVAVISQSAVDKFWSGRDPLQGGRLRFPWPGWQNVIGVVADVRNNDLRNAALPTIYLSYAQEPQAFMSVVARTAGNPQQALSAIRTAVRSVAPDVAVSDEQLVQQMVERSVSAPRSVGLLLVSFGVLALVLGGIGTYGLVAYGVESRRQEFAVRMAIGAGQPAVIRLVMREGLRLAMIGIVVGLAAAFWLTRLLQSLLFGIERTDVVSFAVAPTVLAAVTVLACALPAWRAPRVDPNGALRAS
jgi:ABC-type antimicrobial peptide transport system permease subunit